MWWDFWENFLELNKALYYFAAYLDSSLTHVGKRGRLNLTILLRIYGA
jgi:hypothetical protein